MMTFLSAFLINRSKSGSMVLVFLFGLIFLTWVGKVRAGLSERCGVVSVFVTGL